MASNISAEYANKYDGKFFFNESMKKYNSWRVGGSAEKLFKPASRESLQAYMRDHCGEQIHFVGLGSNILVEDQGIEGTVIILTNCLDELRINETNVYAEAGLPCAKLSRQLTKSGLVGGEFFAGIPGTVGGALAMNAGAWGGETWPHVNSVELINSNGDIQIIQSDEIEYGYRHVDGLKGRFFLSANFSFEKGDVDASKAKVKGFLQERANSQPTGVNSCGSVFRNPEGDYAARLIEKCGLKGYSVGGAKVSTKHANFIVNDNDASAKDIKDIISHIRSTVKNETDFDLVTEVKCLGGSL